MIKTNQYSSSVAQRQWNCLSCILARNASTVYGRRHVFHQITTSREYQEEIPLATYEDLAPLINQIAKGEENILFSGRGIAFENTGGSLTGPKLIPYSQASLDNFQGAVAPWLNRLLVRPEGSKGTAYWATSHRWAGTTPSGISIGIPEVAYLGKEWAKRVMALSAVPAWVGDIANPQEWKNATLYWLLRAKDLFLVWVWSPTFFLSLLNRLDTSFYFLHRLLANGGRVGNHFLSPDPEALKRLENYKYSLDTQKLWPQMGIISSWAEGSSQPFAEELRQRFPQAIFQPKGLLSTEGVVTVPDRHGRNILAIDWGFFEFVDETQRAWLAHEICASKEYEVVLTTAGGLYRYRTGDQVLCEDFTPEGPILTFLGRGNLTSDLVGEKLTEAFVEECLKGIPGFRLLVPTHDPSAGYVLTLEKDPDISEIQLEERLCQNPQYAHARRHNQLAPVRFLRTKDPLKAYVDRLVSNGIRRGDVKVMSLRKETDWLKTFDGPHQ